LSVCLFTNRTTVPWSWLLFGTTSRHRQQAARQGGPHMGATRGPGRSTALNLCALDQPFVGLVTASWWLAFYYKHTEYRKIKLNKLSDHDISQKKETCRHQGSEESDPSHCHRANLKGNFLVPIIKPDFNTWIWPRLCQFS
jgi:hypothetical protein